jgi:fibronectin type 3 domain-containing protein
VPHTVLLSWNPSTSTNVKGYNVYRASIAGGEYSRINATPVSGIAYSDSTVSSGRTYYYVTTAVDTNTVESAYSNQATAVVPTP